jgi:SpoVK/Ycf46/Vps4 family AAA+-type ATPase
MEVGALMGSLVGETEARTRQALAIADAMAPSLLFVDEIDKALAGVQSGGRSDGGVAGRLFGSLLSWLSDRASDVFVIATCNDISALPPEFARAERFDAVFFLDLPSTREKSAIWDLYIRQYEIDPEQRRPIDRSWTGAEIRACCRLARLLEISLVESARQIVPVAATASEAVEHLGFGPLPERRGPRAVPSVRGGGARHEFRPHRPAGGPRRPLGQLIGRFARSTGGSLRKSSRPCAWAQVFVPGLAGRRSGRSGSAAPFSFPFPFPFSLGEEYRCLH